MFRRPLLKCGRCVWLASLCNCSMLGGPPMKRSHECASMYVCLCVWGERDSPSLRLNLEWPASTGFHFLCAALSVPFPFPTSFDSLPSYLCLFPITLHDKTNALPPPLHYVDTRGFLFFSEHFLRELKRGYLSSLNFVLFPSDWQPVTLPPSVKKRYNIFFKCSSLDLDDWLLIIDT